LAERILAERAAMEARGAPDGERKSITALFADIKGSTDLIQALDPEEARSVLDPALQLMIDAVHRYEGYVAQSMGDGIFALFGAPIAHEDHPQRALYAALLMQEESRKQAERLRREKGLNVQIRVGVNTGEVVLRSIRKDDLHADYVPVGQSTHLASRMESLATPGSIVVSEQTYKLTEGYFKFKPLGPAHVKGFQEPIPIYEVSGVGPLRTKLQVAARRGLVRFVGRQSEMEQLRRTSELARAGRGQIVGVMGEPGVGKSRLFYEFVAAYGRLPQPGHRGCLILETFSVSHGKAYPYLPLIDLLKNYFQLALHDDERIRREKITGRVLTLDRGLEDILPYLFFLLGIAEPTSPLQQMDPQIRRQRIFEAIKRLLLRESLTQPLILVFEDLHWLDAETQAFLSLLSDSLPTARILLLVNYRPEYRHEWGHKGYYTQVRLDPLGRDQAEELLTALLGEGGSPGKGQTEATPVQDLKRFILEKTEGNPFFMEEIVQELREQGFLASGVEARRAVPRPTDLHIPTTVQGVLAARIDRLPPQEKALLQTLAVIGREFSSSLLKKVVEPVEEALYQQLAHLQAAEFLYEQPAFPDVEYIFKHALTQEVAYNSLLQERRKVLHERAATATEEVYRYQLAEHYSELAHHYSRSGNTQKAVEYLRLAGEQAVQRSANAEAITHFTTALELLNTLPDTLERTRQELRLQIALGVPLIATRSWAAPETERAYTRARELCEQIGETLQLFPVLYGLYQVYMTRAEYQVAHELGEQLFTLAQRQQDQALLLVAHYALGMTLYYLGEFARAREYMEQGFALYDSPQSRFLTFLYGQDLGVSCLHWTTSALWHLGYPDQARQKSCEVLTLAQELNHPFSLAIALATSVIVHQLRREQQAAQEQANTLIALCTEQGIPFFLAWGIIWRGWILAVQGQGEEGIAQIRQGLAASRATGAGNWQPHFLALLAEAYEKAGQPEEGLTVLAEALAQVNKTGERFYEAELYRLKGELTLQSQVPRSKSQVEQTLPGRVGSAHHNVGFAAAGTVGGAHPTREAEAEGYFLKAIEIARSQQAKSLELRATTSLARLWQRQGKKKEAHELLTKLYDWFTEGFATKDLQEAKALLAELESTDAHV
jgi:predicted ATPase/class 3 adenylate cyclase